MGTQNFLVAKSNGQCSVLISQPFSCFQKNQRFPPWSTWVPWLHSLLFFILFCWPHPLVPYACLFLTAYAPTVLARSSSILTLFTLNYHLYADSFDTLIWAQIFWLVLEFVSLYWIILSKCLWRAPNSLKLNSLSFSPIPAPFTGL